MQGNQYRPTKIPLTSVRPFEYTEVKYIFPICYGGSRLLCLCIFKVQIVLKDEGDIDPNDQNSILEHLDKVVTIPFSHSFMWIYLSPASFLIRFNKSLNASNNIYKKFRLEI